MIRLALLLLGTDFVRHRWRWLAAIGALWTLAGIAIFIDAFDGVLYFPIRIVATLLLIEGLVSLIGTFSSIDRGRRNWPRFIKGVVFILIALLVIDPYPDGIVGSRFSGGDLVGVYAIMGLAWGVGALLEPTIVGMAMQFSPAYGLPYAIAAGCAFFAVFMRLKRTGA